MACRALLQYTSDNTHPGLRASVRWLLGVASAVPDACKTDLLVGTQPLMNVGGGWVRGSLQIGGTTSSHWTTISFVCALSYTRCSLSAAARPYATRSICRSANIWKFCDRFSAHWDKSDGVPLLNLFVLPCVATASLGDCQQFKNFTLAY